MLTLDIPPSASEAIVKQLLYSTQLAMTTTSNSQEAVINNLCIQMTHRGLNTENNFPVCFQSRIVCSGGGIATELHATIKC